VHFLHDETIGTFRKWSLKEDKTEY
jgi:hypothetical protein